MALSAVRRGKNVANHATVTITRHSNNGRAEMQRKAFCWRWRPLSPPHWAAPPPRRGRVGGGVGSHDTGASHPPPLIPPRRGEGVDCQVGYPIPNPSSFSFKLNKSCHAC